MSELTQIEKDALLQRTTTRVRSYLRECRENDLLAGYVEGIERHIMAGVSIGIIEYKRLVEEDR